MLLEFERTDKEEASIRISQIEAIVSRKETGSFPEGSTIIAKSGREYCATEDYDTLRIRFDQALLSYKG